MQTYRDTRDKILTQSLPGSYKTNVTHKPLLFFIFLGFINLALGVLLTILYTGIYDINLPYKNNSNRIEFRVPKTTSDLNFYLQISNFYQSHSYYASSYSIQQLNGKATTNIDSCNPLKYLDGKIIYPCGLMANAYNQDEFRLLRNNEEIPILTDDISWSSTKSRVNNTTYDLDQIVAPPLWEPYNAVPELGNDERFLNWMEQSSFPTFRKLYGKIPQLEPGQYTLFVNKTSIFGNTSVYITEKSWLGSKNYFLSVLMIVCGFILLAMSYFIYKN
ncbi:alkylphosphocholine resistance protein lem3 [Binucleata daphniae]